MRLRTHLWTSTLTALLLYPRKPLPAVLCTSAGVLIDLDHFLVYAWRTGDWNLVGAIGYNRYRHCTIAPGDTRPRYGKLRSWLHQPLLVLPAIWMLARRRSALRPVAQGLTLHLALDLTENGLNLIQRWNRPALPPH
jgi:hypothetical protein